MTEHWIAQSIGFLAFGLGVLSFLQKKDRTLKILMTCQALTLCVHFLLLGAYTGAASVFVTGVRNGVSLWDGAKKLAPLFYIAVLGFGYLTYRTPVDLLPIMAGLIGTTAFFFLSGIRMRLTLVCSSGLWLAHNIIVGSIGPSLMEAMMMAAGIYRATMIYRENKATPTAL